jgi:molybdate transport system substrate-binding protein
MKTLVGYLAQGFLLLALMLMLAKPAAANEVRVLSGGAVQQVLRSLKTEFEHATGHHVIATFGLVTVIVQKLSAGEKADLVFLPMPLIAAAEKTTPMRREGRGPFIRVGVGVLVREDAPPADISTPDAVRKLLLSAGKVAVPEPATLSGAHVVKLIDQLGIADVMRPKLIVKASINGGAELVAKGEADIGMYLLSEIQGIKGTVVVGSLPNEMQSYVVYGAGILAESTAPDAALAFLKYVSDPARQSKWTAGGFEVVRQ